MFLISGIMNTKRCLMVVFEKDDDKNIMNSGSCESGHFQNVLYYLGQYTGVH